MANTLEEDETPECRICRCEADDERPLFYPCACTGSIKWCHESCLVEWIKVSKSREKCETCGTQLVFKPVYSEATPSVLPTRELVWLLTKWLLKGVPYAFRASTVSFVWLICVPLWTNQMFQYLRPISEVHGELAPYWMDWMSIRVSPLSFSAWETGVWLLLAGFFWLFTMISVFDFVRGFEQGEYAAELEAFMRQRLRGPIEEAAAGVDQPRDVQEAQGVQQPHAHIENDPADEFDAMRLDEDEEPGPAEGLDLNNVGDNVLVNNDGQLNNGPQDAGNEFIGFDEWVGLRGPLCLLLNNVLCLCFCVLVFLITFYAVPESLGRGVFKELGWASGPISEFAFEVMNTSKELQGFVNHWSPVVSPQIQTIRETFERITSTSNFPLDGSRLCPASNQLLPKSPRTNEPWILFDENMNVYFFPSGTCPVDMVEQGRRKLESIQVEVLCLVVGLLVTMGFVHLQFIWCTWTWRTCSARFGGSNQIIRRGFPNYMWRTILKTTRTIVRVQKVVCLLVFKMIVFPIILGVLIDRALAPVLELTDSDRVLFMADYPHLTALLLWVAGITHTLLVTMNVILVRDILHRDVLDGIIRMRDPHGNQFLPLLVESITQQTRRTFVTCLIYTMIVVLFVTIPCRVALNHNLVPLPITMGFVSVGVQLPIESTLFHMWMLHVLEKSKPNLVIIQKWFFENVCATLGLTGYLLPVPVNEHEYALALHRAQIQAGQLHWLDSAPRVSARLLKPRVKPSFLVPRLMVLVIIAWAAWFTAALLCVTLPYLLGVAFVSVFPTLPQRFKSDVRLYFVGWFILRICMKHSRRIQLGLTRLTPFIRREWRDLVNVCVSVLLIGVVSPCLGGVFVFTQTALDTSDFPPIKYIDQEALATFASFIRDAISKMDFIRVWLAGLPLVWIALNPISRETAFWRHVYDGELFRANLIAFQAVLSFIAVLLMGTGIGLRFWKSKEATSDPLSPLSAVKLAQLATITLAMLPSACISCYDELVICWREIHDGLKDEKYLMGRRLRNYEARV